MLKIKSPRPLRAALDCERFLITDKHTEILDCIPCVMVIFPSTRQADHRSNGSGVRALTDGRTDGQTDGQTDRRYQTYYLPCFAVDNNEASQKYYTRDIYSSLVYTRFIRVAQNEAHLNIKLLHLCFMTILSHFCFIIF